MWPFAGMSLSAATLVGSIANWALLACLLGGVLATFVIVQTTDIKEEHWSEDRNRSSERIAELNHEAARLQADNLALQTVLLPRHVGLIGVDEQPKAAVWFAGFDQWAGTKLLIQVVPNDAEAQNLANEIAIVLLKFGWHPEMIDQRRSGTSLNLMEGLRVISPTSYKGWNPSDPAHQTFNKLNVASVSLARALTMAGLGVGDGPVPSGGIVVDFPPESDAAKAGSGSTFDPQLDGVYLQVGSRPVASTVAWIKRERPDVLGNKPAAPKALEQHK